ncbi:MAG TPA: hypothetical protein VEK76_13340 [Candidatus Binatia bacterium]|nr:hypothetical protein [Candidatus Binatia bacterium]
MGFGRKLPPGRLLVARSLVYLQAGILLIIAAGGVIFGMAAGGGSSVTYSGLFGHQTLSGSAILGAAVFQLLIAVAAVGLDRAAASNPGSYRGVLTLVEAGLGLYIVGWVSVSAGAWIFGPLLCVVVLALHWWEPLRRLLMGSAGATTQAAATAGAAATAEPETTATATTEGLDAQPAPVLPDRPWDQAGAFASVPAAAEAAVPQPASRSGAA